MRNLPRKLSHFADPRDTTRGNIKARLITKKNQKYFLKEKLYCVAVKHSLQLCCSPSGTGNKN